MYKLEWNGQPIEIEKLPLRKGEKDEVWIAAIRERKTNTSLPARKLQVWAYSEGDARARLVQTLLDKGILASGR